MGSSREQSSVFYHDPKIPVSPLCIQKLGLNSAGRRSPQRRPWSLFGLRQRGSGAHRLFTIKCGCAEASTWSSICQGPGLLAKLLRRFGAGPWFIRGVRGGPLFNSDNGTDSGRAGETIKFIRPGRIAQTGNKACQAFWVAPNRQPTPSQAGSSGEIFPPAMPAMSWGWVFPMCRVRPVHALVGGTRNCRARSALDLSGPLPET